jgi:hypothetical protein
VVVRALEVVGDVTFIHLKLITRSTFSAEKDGKQRLDDMSLILFIKDECHVVQIKP